MIADSACVDSVLFNSIVIKLTFIDYVFTQTHKKRAPFPQQERITRWGTSPYTVGFIGSRSLPPPPNSTDDVCVYLQNVKNHMFNNNNYSEIIYLFIKL